MISIDGKSLTIEEIYRIAHACEKITLSPNAIEAVKRSHENLLTIVGKNLPVYGLNTGFGFFADQIISIDESKKLNRNLILSHSVGTGLPLPKYIMRAAMAIRVNTLAKGFSGVNFKVIDTLVEMLNKDVVPIVYSKGSLGSSGDLCMLAQLAMVLTRDENDDSIDSGLAEYKGGIVCGFEAMKSAGVERIVLSYKDGLALINGATFSTAVLALCAYEAEFMFNLADMTVSLALESLVGRSDAFNAKIHEARGLIGQIESARKIREFI